MKSMSRAARSYISGIMLAGLLLAGWALLRLDPSTISWTAFASLTIAAGIAQFFEAKVGRASYYPSYVFLYAGVVLLPRGLFAAQVVLVLLAEVVRDRLLNSQERRAWYVQTFNVAMLIVAGTAAQLVLRTVDVEIAALTALAPVVQATGAAALYILAINLQTGQALVLARNISWRESGVLSTQNLVTELMLACLGYVLAALWLSNPFLILPAIAPLVLMHRALQIPQLQQEARTDAKTGLYNARYFDRRLNDELERGQRTQRSLALLMADLDFMRNINNTYGHLAGDVVLRAIAGIIRDTIRQHDIAGRFGGEEFSIILPEVSPAVAYAIAERLRSAVEQARIVVPTSREPVRVTTSIGVAYYPDDATTATLLTQAADIAVYESKRLGRNRVTCVWDLLASVKEQYFEENPLAAQPGGAPANMSPATPAAGGAPPTQQAAVILPPPAAPDAVSESPARERLHLSVRLYVGSVIAVGIGALIIGAATSGPLAWTTIALFCGMAIVAELLPVNVYAEHTISVSVTVIFAAALTTGIVGMAAVSAAVALTHHLHRHRSQHEAYKTLFNWATHVIAGLAAVLAGISLAPPASYLQILSGSALIICLTLIYFGVESALIAGALCVSTGAPFRATWRTQFGWLAPHYIGLCLLGVVLAVTTTAYGIAGIGVVLLPLLMMRIALWQYVTYTKHSVADLQRMNREIAASNTRIKHINEELFITLGRVLDARDPYTSGHSITVARYATALARELQLEPEQVENVRRAGILHDIGKIAISDTVLYKNAKLTAEEYEGVKLHSQIGSALLEPSSALRHLAPFVRAHHERWDGQGYPYGLKQEMIPLEGRILAVCDTVEAMASERPYQASQPWPVIRAELERCAGTQFDPSIVGAFIRIVERESAAFITIGAVDIRQPTAPDASTPEPIAANARRLADGGLDGFRPVQSA